MLLAITNGQSMLESLKNVQVLSGALKLSLTFEGLQGTPAVKLQGFLMPATVFLWDTIRQ